jgi:hypothetical protein
MAVIGGQYVSSVVYSGKTAPGTKDADLTNQSSAGITFEKVPGSTGVLDNNGKPLYDVIIKFTAPGVDSVGSVSLKSNSNVDKVVVQLFTVSNPDEPVTVATNLADKTLSLNSKIINSQVTVADIPSQFPAIGAIRIAVLSTKDNE